MNKTRLNLVYKLLQYFLRKKIFSELRKNEKSTIPNSTKIGNYTNCIISSDAYIYFGNKIDIRNNCNFVVGKKAELKIGDAVFMNNSCSINCLEKIEIGENTLFGEAVKIYDHNHQYSSEKVEQQQFNTSPIKIGKNCWLGSNVIVLKGVEIGDNSIIGAGCIIYKNIPANSIVINKQELVIKPM